METVGIRELKAKLSSYIDRAKKGRQIVVTEHGVEVAVISPVSRERRTVMSLVQKGEAQWSGEKPRGLEGIKVGGAGISETILEERQ
jgi:prevent-host-death family protein